MCLFAFVLVVGERVGVVETQFFLQSVEGISMELFSALEESFVRVLEGEVVGGVDV